MANLTEHRFIEGAQMLNALVASTTVTLRRATMRRGQASLVVPGGASARALFLRLAKADIPWPLVTATLTDERWVTITNEESNEKSVREHLLTGPAKALRFVGLKSAEREPEAAENTCERRLKAVPRPFDLVILGMGVDGHIASLFPGAPGIQDALASSNPRAYQFIQPPSAQHPVRMTLTLNTLLDSRHLILLIAGHEKWQTYQHACTPGLATEMPVRGILNQDRVPVDVFWAPNLITHQKSP